MEKDHFIRGLYQTIRTFWNVLPIVIGMLLLTSMMVNMAPEEFVAQFFGRYDLLDVLIGASAGSIAAGHPVASYILGGELLEGGASLLAVTALIVCWVTVGIVQLPAEALMLGRRFAVYRNLWCFGSGIAVAYATVYTLRIFS